MKILLPVLALMLFVIPCYSQVSSDKPTLIIIYQSGCPACTKMLDIVNKMKGQYAGSLDFKECNIGSNASLASNYGIKIEFIRAAKYDDVSGRVTEGTVVTHPLPAIIVRNSTGTELFRNIGYVEENTFLTKFDNAGFRAAPPDPLQKIKVLGGPFYKGKGKARIVNAPSGALTIDIYNKYELVRNLVIKSGDLVWDLKDNKKNDVKAGEYFIQIEDKKGNRKEISIMVLEEKK